MNNVKIKYVEDGPRRCGDCQLCCKLLPMQEFSKPAGKRCQYQRHGKGCSIYANKPPACTVWNCRWLGEADGTRDLRRPDRAGYVLDIVPDFITAVPNDGVNKETKIQVIQVWVDPARPDAWRDPALLAYLNGLGRECIAALIRFDSSRAITVFPPSMSGDGQWHEVTNASCEQEHTMIEKVAAISSAPRIKVG